MFYIRIRCPNRILLDMYVGAMDRQNCVPTRMVFWDPPCRFLFGRIESSSNADKKKGRRVNLSIVSRVGIDQPLRRWGGVWRWRGVILSLTTHPQEWLWRIVRHRSRTEKATAKATATTVQRFRFFGVVPIVSCWAEVTNHPSVSEPWIRRSIKWRLVLAVAMMNRRIRYGCYILVEAK